MKPMRTRSFAPSTRRPDTAAPTHAAAAARPNCRRVNAVMAFSSFVTYDRTPGRGRGTTTESTYHNWACACTTRLDNPPAGVTLSGGRLVAKEREWTGRGSVVAKRCAA